MSGTERRRSKRFETTNVHGSLLFRSRVDVLNISLTGVAVESAERLDVDREYNLTIHHDEEALDIIGKVVWCQFVSTRDSEGDVAPVYRAGLEFPDVLREAAESIRRFIEHNAILTLDQRIFGRFQFRADGRVDVDTAYEFLVKSLSLSGMRIETEIMATPDSIFDMRIDFPESSIDLKGRIVHVRQVNNERGKHPLCEIGVEFSDVAPESTEILAGYIRDELDA
jgi:hypothetical protein